MVATCLGVTVMSTVGTHLGNSFNRVSKRLSRLENMVIVFVVMIAGILTFDFLILWMTSGKFIERFPF
jgi:low affinity Fe/Cu permease